MPEPPRKARVRTASNGPNAKSSSRLLALQREFQGRFVSSGGRPADSEKTIRRLVPLRPNVWKELGAHATCLSRVGLRISKGQLAAVLLEKAVADLQPSAAFFRRN